MSTVQFSPVQSLLLLSSQAQVSSLLQNTTAYIPSPMFETKCHSHKQITILYFLILIFLKRKLGIQKKKSGLKNGKNVLSLNPCSFIHDSSCNLLGLFLNI